MDHVLWSMVVNIELVVDKFIGMDRKFWSIVLDLMTLIWHHIGPIFSVKILILNNRTVPWSIKMDLNPFNIFSLSLYLQLNWDSKRTLLGWRERVTAKQAVKYEPKIMIFRGLSLPPGWTYGGVRYTYGSDF